MYRRAQNYAWKLDHGHNDHNDILHDAFLVWYDKHGKNLFDEDYKTVFRVIKLTFLGNIKKNNRYWFYQGDQYPIAYEQFENQSSTTSTPESELISLELKKNCAQKVKKLTEISNSRINGSKSRLNEVYELLVKGYALFEIALLLGMTRGNVTHYGKQLQSI